MIATWFLVLLTSRGAVAIPMQTADACRYAVEQYSKDGANTPSCINTFNGQVIFP